MPRGPSTLERQGIQIEPDGSIVLDRQRIAEGGIGTLEAARIDHALYHVANPVLTAAFRNPGRIAHYEVLGTGPILEPDIWRLTLSIDGVELTGYPPRTQMLGRWMAETWPVRGCELIVTSFCEDEHNAVYQAYRLLSHDGIAHTLEVTVRAGFVADEDQGTYALHFDERRGAIVAILGETALRAEPWGADQDTMRRIPARVALIGADLQPAEWRISDQRAYLTYRLEMVEQRERSFCLAVSGGRNRTEQETVFQQAIRHWPEALAQARRHGEWLSTRLELDEPVLHSMFTASLNCALSACRQDGQGGQGGLARSAGTGDGAWLTAPCDAYWCAQVLLPYQPERVRSEILTLARAVHDDGRLALGIRLASRSDGAMGGNDGQEWQPDACDSPSYFAMLVHDYLCWTGERQILEEAAGGVTIWEKVQACVEYLRRLDTNHDFLFEKRREQPDWAFDVLRDDWVTYDLAVHYQALKCVAEIALLRGDEERARDLATWAAGVQRAAGHRLWDEARGGYVDYLRSYYGFVEDHAAIDTVVAALFGLATENQSHRLLDRLAAALETHANEEQYYGDWGVMGCYPFYRDRADLRGRSAWAYSFHNGGAWPGWSGVLALAKLLHRHGDWRCPLERWWTYGLERYWFTPTEWYSPPYDAAGLHGSAPLYAWSAMSAAAMILGGFGFWPDLAGDIVLRVPPWGNSRLRGIRFRGDSYDVEARDGIVALYLNGDRIARDEHGLRVRLGRVAVHR